jgi:ERCC4-type nuclease
MIQGAYLHTMFRDNIRILFTKNTIDTATLLLSLCVKIIDNPKKFQNENREIQYTDCIKLKKKKIENIDKYTCYIMQLSQIPHISNIIAKNIAKTYPSMVCLINTLLNIEDKIKELCKIEGIGKEKAGYIIKFLLDA